MRSLFLAKALMVLAAAAALGGCLVSEEPILDASNGAATPIAPGAYLMCPLAGDATAEDCENMVVARNATGLYRFDKDGDEPAAMRFRRIGRRGYATQLFEDDGYIYYYGAGDSERFQLTMMMCADLPAQKRARLIAKGDLETQDEDFAICRVKTLAGLKAAARAYHRGKVETKETLVFEFTPAAAAGDEAR